MGYCAKSGCRRRSHHCCGRRSTRTPTLARHCICATAPMGTTRQFCNAPACVSMATPIWRSGWNSSPTRTCPCSRSAGQGPPNVVHLGSFHPTIAVACDVGCRSALATCLDAADPFMGLKMRPESGRGFSHVHVLIILRIDCNCNMWDANRAHILGRKSVPEYCAPASTFMDRTWSAVPLPQAASK